MNEFLQCICLCICGDYILGDFRGRVSKIKMQCMKFLELIKILNILNKNPFFKLTNILSQNILKLFVLAMVTFTEQNI